MKIIYNNLIPFKGFAAMNLFGLLFVRKKIVLTKEMINHEQIHTAQMKELFYLFFYLIYFIEWLIKLVKYGSKSYYHISFEREAYANDQDMGYLKKRRKWAFMRFIIFNYFRI